MKNGKEATDCGSTVNWRGEADVEGVMSQCHVCVQPTSMPGTHEPSEMTGDVPEVSLASPLNERSTGDCSRGGGDKKPAVKPDQQPMIISTTARKYIHNSLLHAHELISTEVK